MPSTRSSTRLAAAASSSPASSQDASTVNTSAPASKRKGDSIAAPKSKRGKKGNGKAQTKIEDVMPMVDDDDPERNSGDGDDDQKREREAPDAPNEQIGELANQPKFEDSTPTVDDKGPSAQSSREGHEKGEEEPKSMEIDKPDDEKNDPVGDGPKIVDDGNSEADESSNTGPNEEPSNTDGAIEDSSKREETTPSSILEKGLIYFFFRGRVGIEEPSDVNEIARSYIVLRPIPHGAKLGEGSIGDDGTNRLLALPKKVLPASQKDRFMVFVEKANVAMEEIKSTLGSSDYATKTVGTRHSPSATPVGEGVYAITSTGRESHLAYILTIPSTVGEVQQDIGLRERGSFITSAKNPTYPSPVNASLPRGPEFPREILDEFHGRRWMPLQPKMLDYVNAQMLLIGHAGDGLEEATVEQPADVKQDKDASMEEIEKLEHEDELRIKHLKGDDSIFEDLGLNAKEYSGVQTTW